jgi:Cd2+/Zn2+-exporting ATPase
MNALMTIAAIGALGLREWFEAATAMLLFNVSLWLERSSMDRARRAVQGLVQLTPAVAHRIDADGLHDVHPDELDVGERVLVKPGERIPVDGVVVAGESAVNQATITGESMPVERTSGDDVYAGTHNAEGALEVRVGKPAAESTLAHIARQVEQAQVHRAPTARFVDQFARRYTPVVIVLAVLIAFGPPLVTGAALGAWIHRSLVLLVIACPCALVISTPVTIVLGLYQAARRGMLIKGGEHLERAGRVTAVAFDKTGTLTTGEATVIEIVPQAGVTEDEVLRVAASLEQASDHPLAKAILAAARDRRLDLTAVADFSAVRGFGVQGTLDGERCFVGSPRMLRDAGKPIAIAPALDGDAARQLLSVNGTATIALVGTSSRLLGAIHLADPPRTEAARAIAELHALRIQPLMMLTGDSRAVAGAIARELGIDEVHAELLPDDKVREVGALAKRVPHLAMVGDGVNDAPALAAAHLGIALGSTASDVARETADVVILSPRLERVSELVRLGRRCRRLLAQNIVLALAIKAMVLLLAMADWATMWMAVAADVGASLLVIANGMRLVGRAAPETEIATQAEPTTPAEHHAAAGLPGRG